MAFYLTAILTQGIYSGIVGTISTATINTCSLARDVYTFQNPDVNKLIKKLDIERRLKLTQAVIKTINRQSESELNDLEKTHVFELMDSKINLSDDPVELSLISLVEIINAIKKNLQDINTKVANHKQKWFSSWRTLNVHHLLDELKNNMELLDKRFNDLIKIASFLRDR